MWEAFLPSVAGAAALWAALLFGRLRYYRHRRLWIDAAAACGLQLEGSFSSFWGLSLMLKAHEGSLKVRLEGNGKRWRGTRVVVEVPESKRFSEVRMIRRQHSQTPWRREIEVGDEAFDSTFFIEGPMQLLHALLDPEVRRLLIRVNVEGPLEIAGGELRAEVRDELVPEVLSLLLEVGRRFTRIHSAPQRVEANARGDPEAGVRLQNLLFLVGEHPGKRKTEALRTACADPSPQIRLRAAQELGAEGQDVLIELAESAVDDDTWSAQAVSILGRTLQFDRASAILTHALCRHRILTARACLESLGRSGNPGAVDILAKVLASEAGELAAAAALALGETGSTAAEPPLILALQHEDTDVLVAAANALGQVGTAAAVLPLKEVESNAQKPVAAWPHNHRKLRRAARQAIAAIQTRLPGASPGQLSLAGSEMGQLSLATAEAGQLTLATDQAGQLSLPSQEAGQPL